MQAMCQVYAAVSYICIGDAESSSQVEKCLTQIKLVLHIFFLSSLIPGDFFIG